MSTATTPTQTLADLYQAAMLTGRARGDYVYIEMMDSIHITAKAIASGIDPHQAVEELADEWAATARHCGSQADANKYTTWARFLAGELEATR